MGERVSQRTGERVRVKSWRARKASREDSGSLAFKERKRVQRSASSRMELEE